jgi:cob(I)alamin adenosyltransferase
LSANEPESGGRSGQPLTARSDPGTRITGESAAKTDLRVRALGEIDELTSYLGVARARNAHPELEKVLLRLQELLLTMGCDIADPERRGEVFLTAADCRALTEAVRAHERALPRLTRFIVPGPPSPAAELHFSRTIARRLERTLQSLAKTESVSEAALAASNELSDLLYALARRATHAAGEADRKWRPRKPLSGSDLQ